MHRNMSHIRSRFVLILASASLLACDSPTDRKVPSKAGQALSPAVFEQGSTPTAIVAKPPSPVATDPVVATVDGHAIRASQIAPHLPRELGRDPADVAARRARVIQALVDEQLVASWFQQSRPDQNPQDREHLRLALQVPSPSHDAVRQLYAEVTGRPPYTYRYELSSVAVDGVAPSAPGAAEFARLRGRRTPRGWVNREDLVPTLAQALDAREVPGAVVVHGAGPQSSEVYWVHARQESPTEHFSRLQAMIRERATDIAVARAREAKIRQLRQTAEIEVITD